ncbi:MAG: PIN domain-containing protein [Myxococcaceae bacterium]
MAVGWVQGGRRSSARVAQLFESCRAGETTLFLSVVNLAEVLKVTSGLARDTGMDPSLTLQAAGVQLHRPDEAIAYRASKLRCSLADSFAAATAMELGARLHTTDAELVRQLAHVRVRVTRY